MYRPCIPVFCRFCVVWMSSCGVCLVASIRPSVLDMILNLSQISLAPRAPSLPLAALLSPINQRYLPMVGAELVNDFLSVGAPDHLHRAHQEPPLQLLEPQLHALRARARASVRERGAQLHDAGGCGSGHWSGRNRGGRAGSVDACRLRRSGVGGNSREGCRCAAVEMSRLLRLFLGWFVVKTYGGMLRLT